MRVREWESACLLAYAPVPDVDLDVTTRRRFRFNVLRVRDERAVMCPLPQRQEDFGRPHVVWKLTFIREGEEGTRQNQDVWWCDVPLGIRAAALRGDVAPVDAAISWPLPETCCHEDFGCKWCWLRILVVESAIDAFQGSSSASLRCENPHTSLPAPPAQN